MTDAAATEQASTEKSAAEEGTQATPPSPKQSPAPAPDMAKIREEAIAAAKAAAQSDRAEWQKSFREDLARTISGKKEDKELNPLVKAFLTNPDDFVSAQNEVLIAEVEKRFTSKSKQVEEDNRTLADMSKEYPEVVKENLDLIDLMFSKVQAEDSSLSRREVIEEATKRVAKRLRVKPVSERKKDKDFINTAFPGASGYQGNYSGEASSDAKSAMDFIQGRKARAAAIRAPRKK